MGVSIDHRSDVILADPATLIASVEGGVFYVGAYARYLVTVRSGLRYSLRIKPTYESQPVVPGIPLLQRLLSECVLIHLDRYFVT